MSEAPIRKNHRPVLSELEKKKDKEENRNYGSNTLYHSNLSCALDAARAPSASGGGTKTEAEFYYWA